ncbi:MAG TPA: ABC transporter permease [Acidimicrobiia bacterium]|jgi:lipooligosaccharide transport system permease protein|nr:ABC transporter permease [Acidimicrobiia bacterium]
MSVQAPSRITPIGSITPFRAQRIWEKNFLAYRRLWTVVFSGFFEPVFYLFAVGVGMGAYVGTVAGPAGELISYAAFVAPALMAASAMNGAVIETTFNIFFKLQFGKVYEGILTTPMQPSDIAIGEIGWALLRGVLYSTAFIGVMFALGMTESWLSIFAIPAATLIGFAFGAAGMAASTWMRSWQDFDLVTLVTIPLFLFSGTFFPIDVYPSWLQWVVRLSPLYHGTELLRGFTLGVVDWTMLGHAAFLLVMGLVGAAIAARRLDGMLRK